MDISSSINTSAKAIKMPIIKSNQLALEVQDKLNFLLSKNSHSFGDLLPMDAAKACEIAFRLQPEMFNLIRKQSKPF